MRLLSSITHLLIFLSANLFVSSSVVAAVPPDQSPDLVLATVHGRAITQGEVDRSIQSKLYAIEQQKYALRKSALNNIISSIVVQEESKRRGLSVEELRTALGNGAPPVTSEEVEKAYEENGAVMQALNAEEAKERLRLDLQSRARILKYRDEVARLEKAAGVEIRLAEPRLPADSDSSSPALGGSNAAVTLTMFSDFECPYCKAAVDTIHKLRAEYPNKLKIVYKSLPLESHPHAFAAAQAAYCAGEQRRFWEFHDTLFTAGALSDSVIQDAARTLDLDLRQFDRCVAGEL